MHKFEQFWSYLRRTLWFVPSLLVAASVAAAAALIAVDSTWSGEWLAQWPRLFGAGAEGSRGMMTTIAGSMMTVVGVTFSMILVVLSLASSQYTSRILRNFMRSRVTQVVLGIFTGIFTYCLIVLRTIRSGDEGAFVPSLAVFFGFVLALAGIGALMFFIHHIASSIQASNIIASVTQETIATIDRLFPETSGAGPVDDDDDQALLPLPEQDWQAVPAGRHGYIRSVDHGALVHLARKHNTIVRMEHGIGEFVVHGATLASFFPKDAHTKAVVTAAQAAYSIGRYRSVEQDAAFGIRQIVDIALRALSPGVNDTTTAVMCVDYLTAILAHLTTRAAPSARRYEQGELRVIAIWPNFADLVAESFDQIRNSAEGNVAIILRMLHALRTIGSLTTDQSQRKVLREHVQLVAELAERTITSPHDRADVESRLAHARDALNAVMDLSTREQSIKARI